MSLLEKKDEEIFKIAEPIWDNLVNCEPLAPSNCIEFRNIIDDKLTFNLDHLKDGQVNTEAILF